MQLFVMAAGGAMRGLANQASSTALRKIAPSPSVISPSSSRFFSAMFDPNIAAAYAGGRQMRFRTRAQLRRIAVDSSSRPPADSAVVRLQSRSAGYPTFCRVTFGRQCSRETTESRRFRSQMSTKSRRLCRRETAPSAQTAPRLGRAARARLTVE